MFHRCIWSFQQGLFGEKCLRSSSQSNGSVFSCWKIASDTSSDTLQGTNISPKNGILKMIFLFPRWDMLIPWRVDVLYSFLMKGTLISFTISTVNQWWTGRTDSEQAHDLRWYCPNYRWDNPMWGCWNMWIPVFKTVRHIWTGSSLLKVPWTQGRIIFHPH